jgi:hypothetical protein
MNTESRPRRKVQYNSPADFLAEAEAAAANSARTTGNWSLGQIFEHLATAIDKSIDGFGFTTAWPVRLVGRHVLKPRFLRNGMPAGFQLKGRAAEVLVPPETPVAAGLDHLRRSIARLQTETRRAPHPAFGPMTTDEGTQLQLRHAELHMSFVELP